MAIKLLNLKVFKSPACSASEHQGKQLSKPNWQTRGLVLTLRMGAVSQNGTHPPHAVR